MGNTRIDATWQLSEALVLVEKLAPLLEASGFSIGLTGSVLKRGHSKHDLDLIIYPMQSTASTDFHFARAVLVSFGMNVHLTAAEVQRAWRRRGSLDEKEVEVWDYNRKRIDFFFLGGSPTEMPQCKVPA